MSRSKADLRDTIAVRQRLTRFIRERFKSWSTFVGRLDIPRTTSDAWRSQSGSSIPDSVWLLRLARETNLSIDWLLLGEGPMLRHRASTHPHEQLRSIVEAELRQSEGLEPAVFQATWDRLSIRADPSGLTIDEVVFRLAVEGVRVRFHETLRLVRHYALLTWIYEAFRRLHAAEATRDIERAEQARQRFEGILAAPLRGDLSQLWPLFEAHAAEDGVFWPRRMRRTPNKPPRQ